jgi:XrtJ-associated TM-motif-TM protein
MTAVKRFASVAMLVVLFPLVAHAQGGCVNSPENPTIVLFLVGSAGAAVASIRGRIRSRR